MCFNMFLRVFFSRCVRFMKAGRTRCILKVSEYVLITCILVMLLFVCLERLLAAPLYSKYVYKKVRDVLENDKYFSLDYEEQNLTLNPTGNDLRNVYIKHLTMGEKINNQDMHGPLTEDTVVIVIPIQVVTIQIKFLIISLAKARGIEGALIVFSHSYYHEGTNRFIQGLKFCKIMQIYYPHPIKVFDDQFPAFNRKDCPHVLLQEYAEEINCTPAFSPDIHGRYRDPSKAELKHHWWWTANQVFDGLRTFREHTGVVVFIDGDYYVTEDFIYMLLFLKHTCGQYTKCEMLSLTGDIKKNVNINLTSDVVVTTWEPHLHSKVVAFSQATWDVIVAHFDKFCVFDDYSWARSLFFISLNRKLGTRFRVATPVVPRAYQVYTETSQESTHIVEHNVMRSLFSILTHQEKLEEKLFPPYLMFDVDIDLEYDEFVDFDYMDNNGGWGDPRDRNLCIRLTVNKMKKIYLDMSKHSNDANNDENV